MGSASTNPLGVEWFGLVMGLGFVLSFGYWCTDFLVVQRAMAADSMTSARRTPLIAAVPKMFFPFLVILPGLIAIALPTPEPSRRAAGEAGDRGEPDRPGDHPGEGRLRDGQGRCSTATASRCSTTTWRSPRCCCTTSRPACSASA